MDSGNGVFRIEFTTVEVGSYVIDVTVSGKTMELLSRAGRFSRILTCSCFVFCKVKSWARDNPAATTWPRLQATKLTYCIKTTFVVATSLRHRNLIIFRIFSCPSSSITLSRCRCGESMKMSSCSGLSVPNSPLIAKAYDAGLIKVTDISDGVVGDLSTFRGNLCTCGDL